MCTVCLVTHDINHIYGLSQAIPTLTLRSVISHTVPIIYDDHKQVYTHTHDGLACKVQGLHNRASTTAHSHCLAFTYNSLHKAKRTHTGDKNCKKVVFTGSFTLVDKFSKRQCLFCRQNDSSERLGRKEVNITKR